MTTNTVSESEQVPGMITLMLFIQKYVDNIGKWGSFFVIPLVLVTMWDVISRKLIWMQVFLVEHVSDLFSSTLMQEMEWHLFAVIFLFGIGIALKDEGHVRVDFLFDRFSKRKKAIVNILGTLFFLMPFALLILTGSFEYVNDAYITQEISEDPGGLPYRWLIKGMIPLSFIFLCFCAVGYVLQNIRVYQGEVE